MKIAALSDIHSNVFALEAVINDIKHRSVDVVVNLGDILYGPIEPRDTYDLLMEHDFVTIRGNQDRQIYEATQAEIDSNPTMQFILDDLGKEPLEWMRSLPFDNQLTADVYLCHGTPSNDLIYLLESVTMGRPMVREDQEILSLLGNQNSEVIICGHTHIPRSVHMSTEQLIVNPGSVGLPAYTDDEPCLHSMETFSPDANYAVIEKTEKGWQVEHIKVPYDHHKAAASANKRGREDWAHFLTTGRGL